MATASKGEGDEPKVVTAKEVLIEYTKGDLSAVLTYKKMCNAFDLVDKWSPDAARQFLLQMVDIANVVDNTCKTLVYNISKLRWNMLPVDLREPWRDLLVEIGVSHVIFLDLIYLSAIQHLVPLTRINESGVEELIATSDDQDEFYGMAHSIISQLLFCVPVSSKIAIKKINRTFPHHSASTVRWTTFLRNLINVSDYAGGIREMVWKIIIDNLITVDTLIYRPSHGNDNGMEIFQFDDMDPKLEDESLVAASEERVAKLNLAMKYIMEYLKGAHSYEVDKEDTDWIHCTGDHTEKIFAALQSAFIADLLITPGVRFVSFLWLFLGSLRTEYPSLILSSLWDIVVRPSSVPGEAKRSQGAAAYLAAFIARARYVDIEVAEEYLRKMASYLASYVERVGLSSRTIIPGLAHHGIFYALSNSFFLAFTFRYKDIVKNNLLDEVRRWSIGRIVNSSLDPLKYSHEGVARCFAAISRSLQLVYCSHIIPLDKNDSRRPFDLCFPFEAYTLDKTVSMIDVLTRKFSPMKEDSEVLKRELNRRTIVKEDDESEATLDFLEDVDEMQIGSVKSVGGLKGGGGSIFAVYSTSPGLRPFLVGSPMDTR